MPSLTSQTHFSVCGVVSRGTDSRHTESPILMVPNQARELVHAYENVDRRKQWRAISCIQEEWNGGVSHMVQGSKELDPEVGPRVII